MASREIATRKRQELLKELSGKRDGMGRKILGSNLGAFREMCSLSAESENLCYERKTHDLLLSEVNLSLKSQELNDLIEAF